MPTPAICAAPNCTRPAAGRGLCKRHHQQWRRHTAHQRKRDTPEHGSVDGYGRYGILERDDDTVLCHECGQRLKSLGVHLRRTHHMTVAEYRRAHGLAWNQSLLSLRASEERSRISKATYAQQGTRFRTAGGQPGQRKPTPLEAHTLTPKPPGRPPTQ